MNIFGMPALIEFDSVRRNLELGRELGLDFVELNMNLPYSFPENIDPRELRSASREGMAFSMHLHDELDLGSLHSAVRRGHLSRCEEALRWGSRNNVFLLNLHLNPGVYFTLPDRKVWVYDRYVEEYISALNDSFSRLSSLASGLGMKICVENTGHLARPFMRRAVGSLLDLDAVGLCWDIGHDARSGWAESDFMMGNLERVWHMHFHDYDGRSDHQLPFTGKVDCPRFLDLARERGMSLLVEVKTEEALRRAVGDLRARGYAAPSKSVK